MKMKLLTLLVAAVLFSPALAIAQIGQTASLTGTVTDSSGAVLPGVTVTAASEAVLGGSRTTVTDENGVYRFPALPPGTYSVKVELSGFRPATHDARLQLGQTITVDAKLEPGGITETVEVTGAPPVVDVRSSSAQKNLTEEVLEYIPYSSRFGPDAIKLAPGVNPNNLTAYGSGGENSNAYLIDGVDTSDPDGGSQWLFANYNWFQEVQVIGLGAPAEYGGFTGVASNSLIRSGSNKFSGLFETLYQSEGMIGDNLTEEVLAENPALTSDKIEYVTDTTVQVGGPIVRDKMWFFSSFQYYRPKTSPPGFPPPGERTGVGPTARVEKSPRFIAKPTIRLGQADQLTGFIEYDSYTVEGAGAASNVSPEATTLQTGPEVAWNANYTKVLSASAVFDIKYSGYDGYYAREPYNGRDLMGWYDVDTDFYSVNNYYWLRNDRGRHQVNATVTKFASGFAGQHSLKFGAEFERSRVKNEVGYPGGGYVLASYGVPYYAFLGGDYLQDATNRRISLFVQDSWAVGRRLTITPGLRFDRYRGSLAISDDDIYKTTAWGPRVGFAYDMFANGRTVIRGHYGRYFDGAKANYYILVNGTEPVFGAYIDPVSLQPLHEPYLLNPGSSIATVSDDLKQPRLDQFIVGFEHELFPNFAVGANGIFRDNNDFIEDVLVDAEFAPVPFADPGPDDILGTADDTGRTLTFYDQLSDPADDRFFINNPSDAFRRYRGLELTANKRFTDGWMLQASWVISKITGNITNTSNAGNSVEYDDPNQDPRFQPFREGRLTRDNTHIAKVLGAVRVPFGVMMSGAFYYTTGGTYTRVVRQRLEQGAVDLFAEERGSNRLDGQPQFDMKFEKRFRVSGSGELGLTVESFNLFNNGAVDDRFTRSGGFFGQPQSIVAPRSWRIGGVFRF